jgi:AbiV family abortive infection protein
VSEDPLAAGFLEPIAGLTPSQVEHAAEVAVANAYELLDEADLLRANEGNARAFFLAHIACEEVGKLPILITASVSDHLGLDVDWRRIDRVLRTHTSKIAQVLFMDSIVGGESLAAGAAAYDADLRRMRAYTDLKNASLYTSLVEGEFRRPSELISGEFFDLFRPLAHGRVGALEGMYLRPIRSGGGLPAFLERMNSERMLAIMETLTGPEGRAAFEAAGESGDDSEARALLERLLGLTESGPPADQDGQRAADLESSEE